MKTIGEVVVTTKQSAKQEELANFFFNLNLNLKKNHEKYMCVTKIDMNSRINNTSFVDTVPIGNRQDIKDDIEEFSLTAINSFLYLNSYGDYFVPLTKEQIINAKEDDKRFIESNILPIVPGDRFLLDSLEGNVQTYYDEYIKNLQNTSGYGNSNNLSKVYSTQIGRAYSEKNQDAAFVNIMFYPVIISSISILLAVIYVTVSILI